MSPTLVLILVSALTLFQLTQSYDKCELGGWKIKHKLCWGTCVKVERNDHKQYTMSDEQRKSSCPIGREPENIDSISGNGPSCDRILFGHDKNIRSLCNVESKPFHHKKWDSYLGGCVMSCSNHASCFNQDCKDHKHDKNQYCSREPEIGGEQDVSTCALCPKGTVQDTIIACPDSDQHPDKRSQKRICRVEDTVDWVMKDQYGYWNVKYSNDQHYIQYQEQAGDFIALREVSLAKESNYNSMDVYQEETYLNEEMHDVLQEELNDELKLMKAYRQKKNKAHHHRD